MNKIIPFFFLKIIARVNTFHRLDLQISSTTSILAMTNHFSAISFSFAFMVGWRFKRRFGSLPISSRSLVLFATFSLCIVQLLFFIARLSDHAPHSFVCYWKIVPTFGAATQADSWVYFAVGTLLWAYQAFDNMDGKQARRTGSSSALGELVTDAAPKSLIQSNPIQSHHHHL